MANQNFNQGAAYSPVKCVHKEVPLTPHVRYYIDKRIVESAKFCVMITNLGELIRDYGFRQEYVADCNTSVYDILDSLETDVRTDFFAGKILIDLVDVDHNDEAITFLFGGLYEEAENHFAAYYEYKSNRGNLDKI